MVLLVASVSRILLKVITTAENKNNIYYQLTIPTWNVNTHKMSIFNSKGMKKHPIG